MGRSERGVVFGNSRSLRSAWPTTGHAPVGMTRWSCYIKVMRGLHKFFVLSIAVFVLAAGAYAQQDVIHPKDTSALHPPAGSKVAIVEFADLECPMCGRDNPIIVQAVNHYHVAWVRHDFPLPQHNWSFPAAVNARWFDTK